MNLKKLQIIEEAKSSDFMLTHSSEREQKDVRIVE